MFKDELFTRVRARRDSDDDDVGLPHSPCTSPTTVDVLTQGLKEKSSKSHTAYSPGSLLSMGSSENDEDSAGQSSGHSSRMSLIDRRSLDSDGDADSSQPVPLNHNAAHHRIAVRPKRTYGLPRRRMNQIAAAKVSTLPSTPEVTEDCGKTFQKLDAMNINKTFTELSGSSINETSSSRNSSEWQVSHMTSSFSYNEVSELTKDAFFLKEKSSESCSKIYGGSINDSSQSLSDLIIKKLDTSSDDSILGTGSKISFSSKENDNQFNVKEKSDFHPEFKNESFPSQPTDNTIGNSKSYDNLEISKQTVSEINEFSLKENDIAIRVSSLVKNLEKSESFKSSEKMHKVKDEINTFSRNSNEQQQPLSFPRKMSNENFEEEKEVSYKPNIIRDVFSVHSERTAENPNAFSTDQDVKTSDECCAEVKASNSNDKLDINSEFVLKAIKKDISLDSNLESVVKGKCEKQNPLISSLYFEESIMSSKSLSMGVEESGIFVSHHAPSKNDFEDMVVTEAHNFAAVEENVGVFIQPADEISLDKKNDSETWISSVDIPVSIDLDNDVTVNSSTSTVCDSKMTDEKITISVHSKSESTKSDVSSHTQNDANQNSSGLQKSGFLQKQDVDQHCSLKEKKLTAAVYKSHPNEPNSNTTSVKSNNTQKRVSVEIVPFSQRMKERKYQPISFSNKDSSLDQSKKNSNIVVERKLSDRKVSAKNKEVDKTSSRHSSFSGALISDKKEECGTEKKIVKPDKMQYPVQIRIHKSVPKPEIKDKVFNATSSNKASKNSTHKGSSSDVKFQMQTAKLNQSDCKFLKEEKNPQDTATKWEVKIQPSVSHCNTQNVNTTENNSLLASETIAVSKSEYYKSSQTGNEDNCLQTQYDESSSVKSHDINWRSPKEIPSTLSDDPEPELLRVFARRSIKQKHCDKVKVEESENPVTNVSFQDSAYVGKTDENNEISISDNSTVIKISEISKPHIKTNEIKKKSKSFCEKEKIRSVSPLKEMNLIHRESLTKLTTDSSISSETTHPRQRLANVPDIPLNLPPVINKNSQKESNSDISPAPSVKEEIPQRTSSTSPHLPTESSINGTLTSIGLMKESQEILNDKEAHAPSWLQLAQQRRELREQRERLLLGGSPNSFMDASNKPTRSSKVWDMVNNFQKLQMT